MKKFNGNGVRINEGTEPADWAGKDASITDVVIHDDERIEVFVSLRGSEESRGYDPDDITPYWAPIFTHDRIPTLREAILNWRKNHG